MDQDTEYHQLFIKKKKKEPEMCFLVGEHTTISKVALPKINKTKLESIMKT